MPTYDRVTPDVDEMVGELVAEHYPDVAEAGVTVACLFAYATRTEDGMKTGPALKLNGYACSAVIKVNSLKDRVEGKSDCTITIDGDGDTGWRGWDDERRRAVLDHEIHHIDIQRDDDGAVKSDDHGRPKIKCRLHDWQIGGFAAIAERHGAASIEVDNAVAMRDEFGQLLFSFADAFASGDRPGRRQKATADARL